MFDLFAENMLFTTHKLTLVRNGSEWVRIEVLELIGNAGRAGRQKFTARVIDALGIPNNNFTAHGDTLHEAVNGLLPQAQTLPLETLCPRVNSTADLPG